MQTEGIIREIKRLPISQRIFVAEQTIHSIRIDEQKASLKKASEIMYKDYLSDKELTTFTQLDFENFYETK